MRSVFRYLNAVAWPAATRPPSMVYLPARNSGRVNSGFSAVSERNRPMVSPVTPASSISLHHGASRAHRVPSRARLHLLLIGMVALRPGASYLLFAMTPNESTITVGRRATQAAVKQRAYMALNNSFVPERVLPIRAGSIIWGSCRRTEALALRIGEEARPFLSCARSISLSHLYDGSAV